MKINNYLPWYLSENPGNLHFFKRWIPNMMDRHYSHKVRKVEWNSKTVGYDKNE
ncbi:MAG: hypothetical protein ACOCWA_01630 [Bacteroidota bacterium]